MTVRKALAILLVATTLGCPGDDAFAAVPPGPVTMRVDLTRAPQRILHATLSMPVEPGPLTLYYPKYMPGEHGPTGPAQDVAGLRISAGGRSLQWDRDPRDLFVFRVQVPPGTNRLDIEMDYLPPRSTPQIGNGPTTSDMVAILLWHTLLLYPAGSSIHELRYQPSLLLPDGWDAGTALRESGRSGNEIRYESVSLAELVDSPLIAGRHFRRVDLTGRQPVRHGLHIAADSAEALELRPQTETAYRKLVAEGNALFDSYHYRSYDFLLTLSDHVAHFGLEHHESSNNRLPERSLIEDERLRSTSTLLPHEYVHSWNAKYRRPAGLTRDDFQEPFDPDLLWVYEGLTEYLEQVLTARSGLWTPEYTREALAEMAAELANRPGRDWRPLVDTARAVYMLYEVPTEWDAWRRDTDFYPEGALIWLEADVLIRTLTRNRRSLDDFCRAFFGGENGSPVVRPYTYDDLTAALSAVAGYDWRAFFDERVYAVRPEAPLGGITGSGWELVYTDKPNVRTAEWEGVKEKLGLWYSLGLNLDQAADDKGRVLDVLPGSPAGKAGVPPGSVLLAVNGRRWSKEVLLRAIEEARAGTPVRLLVENMDYFHEYALDYRGGARYPHLRRRDDSRDLLHDILAPRTR